MIQNTPRILSLLFTVFIKHSIGVYKDHTGISYEFQSMMNMNAEMTQVDYDSTLGYQNNENPRMIGDFNGDGKDDILGCLDGVGLEVAISDGKNGFLAKSTWKGGGDLSSTWTSQDATPRFAADMDGDGKADWVGFHSSVVHVAYSDGSNFPGSSGTTISDFNSAAGYASQNLNPRMLGDVNGDGKADLVGIKADGIYVMLATATRGVFEPVQKWYNGFGTANTWTSQTARPRMLADVDGDGKLDLVGFYDTTTIVAFSDGTKFETAVDLLTDFGEDSPDWDQDSVHPRRMGDVDGDGKADIIGMSKNKQYVSFSKGRDGFMPKQAMTQMSEQFTVDGTWSNTNLKPRFTGDFDGDGLVDYIGFGSSGVLVSFNERQCSHQGTRDFNNDCKCNPGLYDAGIPECQPFPIDCGIYAQVNSDGDDVKMYLNNIEQTLVDKSSSQLKRGIYAISLDRFTFQVEHQESFDTHGHPAEATRLLEFITDGTKPMGDYDIVLMGSYGAVEGNMSPALYARMTSQIDWPNGIQLAAGENFASISKIRTAIPYPLDQQIDPTFARAGTCIAPCSFRCASCQEGIDNCLTCSTNRENPPACTCQSGYYEVGQKPSCQKLSSSCGIQLTSISYGGYDENNETKFGNYINDERKTISTSNTGAFFTVVDSQGNVTDEKNFKLLNEVQANIDMIAFINSLPTDTTVMLSSRIDMSNKIDAQGYTALESLGLGTNPIGYVDAFAMIGKKGASIGSTPQQHTPIASPNYAQAIAELCLVPCFYQCNMCEKSPSVCSACSHSDRITAPSCECRIGTYDDGINAACISCDHQCKSCQLQSDKCIECSDVNRDKNKNCDCKFGYFNEGINPICQKCSAGCLGCSGSAYNCEKCSDLVTRDKNNQCLCYDGYVDTGEAVCEKCQVQCINCTSNSANCDQCFPGQNRSMQLPECGCLDGYYSLHSSIADCFRCPEECKKCSDQNTCLECSVEDNMLPNCKVSQKGNTVIIGENGLVIDVQCDKKCVTCSSGSSDCLQCQGKNRENNVPNCDCLEGYTDKEGVLLNCQAIVCKGSGCIKCGLEDKCDECQEQYTLKNGQCVCKSGYQQIGDICSIICKQNEYQKDSKTCKDCYYYQNLCLKECPKDTESDSQNKFLCVEKSSSTILIIVIVGILLIVLESFLVVMYCIQQKKNIQKQKRNGFSQISQQQQQQQQSSQQIQQIDNSLIQDI